MFSHSLILIIRKRNSKKKIKRVNLFCHNSLVDPKEDSLDRERLAERIFDLVSRIPSNVPLRIGIVGSWGSGKTTILNFIKHQCEKEKKPVAFFHPWQFHSYEEARIGFVSSIENGLDLWKKAFWSFKRKRAFKGTAKAMLKIVWPKYYSFAEVIDNLISTSPKSQLAESKLNVNKKLKKILGKEQRFYIFIDDLDRSEPTIIYDMLMLLNEIIDLDQCIYIIGLDVKTISEVLKNKLGYTNPKDFIDKIINWSFELPTPSSPDWETFLNKEYGRIKPSTIKKDTIFKILHILPKNPRKFKHYLRYLDGLHQTFLNQLDNDERDWELLYLCQLLNLEFPDISRDFRQDNEIINGLTDSSLDNLTLADWENKIKEELEKYGDIDMSRFLKIYQAIREKMSSNHRTAYTSTLAEHIRKHLFVIEELELITKKEYHGLKEKLLDWKEQGLKYELKKLIADSTESKSIGRFQTLMKALLKEKDKIFDSMMELTSKNEMQDQLNKCEEIISICDFLTDADALYRVEKPIFDKATFGAWYDSLLHQSKHAATDNSYKKLHDSQTDLLFKVVKKNLIRVFDMLKHMETAPKDDTTQEIREKIRAMLDERLVEDFLNRFDKEDGIKKVYEDPDKFKIEHDFLSKNDSPFYSESYKKLEAIAAKAEENDIVRENFFYCLQIIWKPIIRGNTHESYRILRQIMQKQKLLQIIWKASVCCPLKAQCVKTLEKAIQTSLKDEIIEKDYFERPKWWFSDISLS